MPALMFFFIYFFFLFKNIGICLFECFYGNHIEFLSLRLNTQHFWTEFNRHQIWKYFGFIFLDTFFKTLAEQTMKKK